MILAIVHIKTEQDNTIPSWKHLVQDLDHFVQDLQITRNLSERETYFIYFIEEFLIICEFAIGIGIVGLLRASKTTKENKYHPSSWGYLQLSI